VTHPLVERFRSGDVPDQAKAAAARGALPLPAEDLLQVLFHLRREKALQADIIKTVSELPEEPLVEVAAAASTSPEMLDFLVRAAFKRVPVVEKALLNPGVGDATLTLVAQRGSASLLELLMLNQVRLTRNPALIQAMLDNEKVTLSIRRRLKEIWDLHAAESAARKARKARAVAEAAEAAAREEVAKGEEPAEPAPEAAAAGEAAPEAGQAAGAELAELADLDELEDLGESQLDAAVLQQLQEEGASEDQLRLAERLLTMSVADKVQLALKGNREARSVLIREASKLIQEAVIKSPKITEKEIESFSTMRSLSQDVLRQIAQNREYTRNYLIAHNLVKNPRTPQPNAIQLMANLQSRDLKFLMKDKGVGEAIRRQARILIQKREQKK
jgi:hypothetical protein